MLEIEGDEAVHAHAGRFKQEPDMHEQPNVLTQSEAGDDEDMME